MNEIWKDIKNYEGLYQISNLGRIKRVDKNKILKYAIVYNGYYRVCLCKNGKAKDFRVHRLVAETFIPNDKDLEIVNHKDGNKKNNKVEKIKIKS